MAGRLVAPPACSALTVGPVCRPDAGALAVEPLPSARSQASRYAGGPSFDDVQDLGGARKFFPAHEFMRQAFYPLEIGGNYPLRLGFCPAQFDLNSRRRMLVEPAQDKSQVR
jgi:hypothetical protein